MRSVRVTAVAALVGLLASPSTAHHRVLKGDAVYYSNKLAGNTMACGGKYLPRAMVAAHRWLDCGRRVRVRNTRNNKAVTVTIRDRGPYGDKDVKIDVSRRAARRLGFWNSGAAPVKIRILHR